MKKVKINSTLSAIQFTTNVKRNRVSVKSDRSLLVMEKTKQKINVTEK